MNNSIKIPTELLSRIMLYADSFEEIYNLAVVKKGWFRIISKFIRNDCFTMTRESLILDNVHNDANSILEYNMRVIISKIIVNTKFPNIKLITIKVIEVGDKEVEYLINNYHLVEEIEIVTKNKILAKYIRIICSKIITLKFISLKYRCYNRGTGNSKSSNESEGSFYTNVERKLVVRRPRYNSYDFAITNERSIKKYLEFYTQEINVN
ncbi:hypothetical protein HWI79_201 [Cryptosporidium felis]|nr:hypothetical protein HWI79_201 [Cryptosporidium felis]